MIPPGETCDVHVWQTSPTCYSIVIARDKQHLLAPSRLDPNLVLAGPRQALAVLKKLQSLGLDVGEQAVARLKQEIRRQRRAYQKS